MALTGVFPQPGEPVAEGPLRLVRCGDCGLVQLGYDYHPDELYGGDYGYRSGLNPAMADHLGCIVEWALSLTDAGPGEIAIDIGSNDGTLLRFYPADWHLIGIDPTAARFAEHYRVGIDIVPELFRGDVAGRIGEKARVITSIAMFYDLPDPVAFARDVMSCLHQDGIWITEQSYLPAMVRANAYDTICHEHFEYYTIRQVAQIAQVAGAKIVDVRFNDVNGGSFAVALAHQGSRHTAAPIDRITAVEDSLGYQNAGPLDRLAHAASRQRDHLRALLSGLERDGKTVLGYGASTKGNVLLQYCGVGPHLVPAIAEINPDKFGRVTPGTGIPIVSDAEAREMRPDYFLVLPWHFRQGIVERERAFLAAGGRLIFPLPSVEVVG